MKKLCALSVSLAAGLLAFATGPISIAQTSTPAQSPPPAAGPTMEQTVASLNDTSTTQGSFTFTIHTDDAKVSNQRVVLEGPCTLLGTADLVIPTVDTRPSRLLLDRADPLSLTLYTIRDSSPAVYMVLVSQPATHEDESRYIFAKSGVGIFYRKELAERFEKALIHAIVLCHKSAPPSPASASGPTIEQTIAFISDSFTKQGDVFIPYSSDSNDNTAMDVWREQRTTAVGSCELTYHADYGNIDHF